ncbi:MAG: DUF5686 and carboxypeptidase regulatory-like domain-containing protein [Bacteroidota bacterium]
MKKTNYLFFAINNYWMLMTLGLILIGLPVQAQKKYRFSGEILDSNRKTPINFASVSVDGTRYGTLSQNGRFSLMLPEGRHKIKISHLGYASLEEEILLNAAVEKTFFLEEESVELDEVIISSDGRDPAYAIIRQAIDLKKQNKIPFPQYEYQAYTKAQIGFQEGFDLDSMAKAFVSSRPNRRQRSEVDSSDFEDILPSNILFLSENVSQMYVKAPDKLKEKIKSSRVSGASEQFSPLGNSFNRFDVYENRAFKGGLAERGIISPIADNAFFFYKFKLLGQLKEEGNKIYKIQVIPKRMQDPVFQGLVYIADSSYAVQNLDLFVSKEQAIQVVDTLRINQEYRKIREAWLPLSTRTRMAFSFKVMMLSFPITGTFTSLLSDYQVRENIEKKNFGLEIISFADTSSLYKDKVWWDSIRPIPLSELETLDYQFKDSVEQRLKSPEYLDSLTQAQEFTANTLLMGGDYKNYRKNTIWRFVGMAWNSGFNAIEGAFIGQGLDRIWDKKDGRQLKVGYRLRYGFANKNFGAILALDRKGNRNKNVNWGIKGGNFVQQFSRPDQITNSVNSIFATYFKRSYVRLYKKEFFESYYNRELFNGLTLFVNARYENRGALQNSSDYSFFFKDREFDPNLFIPDHKALITDFKLAFKPFNKYMSLPGSKVNMGSAWPLFEFVYSRSWERGDEYVDFERIKLSVSGNLNLGIFGNSTWKANWGKYLNASRLFLPDLFHFQGNEVYMSNGAFDQFFLMPYYEFSATRPFFEAHLEHAFGGFIFNKIPGIRRWKLSEYAGLHLLLQEGNVPYLEFHAGLAKRIFKVLPLRIDFNMRLAGNTRGEKYGFKIVNPGVFGSGGSVSVSF